METVKTLKIMKYRHIGYFYADEDLVALSDSSADEVIAYLENGCGEFIVFCADIESDASDLNELDGVQATTDGKHIVVRDSFIDIYKRVE